MGDSAPAMVVDDKAMGWPRIPVRQYRLLDFFRVIIQASWLSSLMVQLSFSQPSNSIPIFILSGRCKKLWKEKILVQYQPTGKGGQ